MEPQGAVSLRCACQLAGKTEGIQFTVSVLLSLGWSVVRPGVFGGAALNQ